MKNEKNFISEVNYIFETVSEKIEETHLKDFILTTLKKYNIEVNNQVNIFYSYLEHTNEYQISYFEKSKDSILVPLEYFEVKQSSNILFYCEEYFALFVNKQLYYYQCISQEMSLDEIIQYIQKRYLIVIDEVESLQESDIQFNQKREPLNYITHAKPYRLMVLMFLCASLLFSLVYTQLQEESTIEMVEIKAKKELSLLQQSIPKSIDVSKALQRLVNLLKVYEINLIHFEYKKGVYEIKASALHKENIYLFLKIIDSKIQYQSIDFDKKLQHYVLSTKLLFF